MIFNIGLLKGCTPIMEKFDFFHKKALALVMFISIFMGFTICVFLLNEKYYLDKLEKSVLEVVWTVVPGFVLFMLAVPSLSTLYYLDLPSSFESDFSFQVVGHQWYWDYSWFYSGLNFSYSSYMKPSGHYSYFRNLEVELPMVVPGNSMIRAVVSSEDVMHSFALPQLGVKVDGVPGRYKQLFFFVSNWGKFYGQCSEICGANHSFMPISVEVMKFS